MPKSPAHQLVLGWQKVSLPRFERDLIFLSGTGLPAQNITLKIDWGMLGLDPRNTSLCAPQLLGIQTKLPQEHPFGLYADGDTLTIPSGGGLWLVLTTPSHPIVDVFEIGQPLGCCTGQEPPH